MAARRYWLQLAHHGGVRRSEQASLDPADDDVLREHLERLVVAERGSLRRVDLSAGWELRVRHVAWSDQVGAVFTRVSVDRVGRTAVKR
jgi:hypothetical protein